MSKFVDEMCIDYFGSDRLGEIVHVLRFLAPFDEVQEVDEDIRRVLLRLSVVSDEDSADEIVRVIRSEAHNAYPKALAGAKLASEAFCLPVDPLCDPCELLEFCPWPRNMPLPEFLRLAYKKAH